MSAPARYWADRVTYAHKMQANAERYAERLENRPLDPRDDLARGLQDDLIRAVRSFAFAWAQYAYHAEQRFSSAADAEMAAADENAGLPNTVETGRTLAQDVESRTFGRTYDVPRCPHGCCPDAVCAFIGDCDHGSYTPEEVARFYSDGAA